MTCTLEAGEDRGQAEHVRDERERRAHRLAQDHHEQREDERRDAEDADEDVSIMASSRCAAAVADTACADS